MSARASWLLALVYLMPSLAQGQRATTRQAVPRGEVTGLEMGIEGSLSTRPGETFRWFVTLYEVVGGQELRPSAGSELVVTASFSRQTPVATVRTDSSGAAAVAFEVPADLERRFTVMVRATSRRRITRTFDVGVELLARYAVEVTTDRSTAPPGGSVIAFGRVWDQVTGSPVVGGDVRLRPSNQRGPLRASTELTTDASGFFWSEIALPDASGRVSIRAEYETRTATASVAVERRTLPALWVDAQPARSVVSPGETVPVLVEVRTRTGAPIEGAHVTLSGQPPIETGADGRAECQWQVPRVVAGRFVTVDAGITVVDSGRGTVSRSVQVRVTRRTAFAELAVLGGALVPELEGRVFLHLVGPDGRALVNERVELTVPRLGGAHEVLTDANGDASFEGTVAAVTSPDGCGGPTGAEITYVVSGRSERACLPVAPDVPLTVRSAARTETSIEVVVARRPVVSRRAVEVVALVRRDERNARAGWAPVSRVRIAAGETRAELSLPAGYAGEVYVRARPILDGGRSARGASLLVFRSIDIAPMPALRATAQGASIEGTDRPGTVMIVAVDRDRARALRASLFGRLGPVGAALDRDASALEVAALLASRTPRDDTASAVLRGGAVLPQPMPEDPSRLGLLRDPWRTRARFVRGRLGRLMLAVESYVDSHIPDSMENVRVPERTGRRFNAAILHGALTAVQLGDEAATGLGGEPLDIASLEGMDRAFTFDNVARRLTRRRLFRLNAMLRHLVLVNGLDREWARLGEPRHLLVDLLSEDNGVDDWGELLNGEAPEHGDLFDGWGNPFDLRPRGGRAGFDFLEPVSGWVLASRGPDGRAGTRDDVVDPFARILPSGGLYAEAVGEDVLLARLNGVALGRATIGALTELFDLEVAFERVMAETSADASSAAPPPIVTEATSAPSFAASAALGAMGTEVRWEPPVERRAYEAVAIRYGTDGSVASSSVRFEAGREAGVRVELSDTMRPGERLRFPLERVHLGSLETASRPTVTARVVGRGLRASIDGETLVLEALGPGLSEVVLSVALNGEPIESFHHNIRVVPSGGLRARHTGARSEAATSLSVEVPAGSRPWRGELVVGSPGALARDPMIEAHRGSVPSVFAWSDAMLMHDQDAETMAAMALAGGSEGDAFGSAVEAACALIAWSHYGVEGPPIATTIAHVGSLATTDLDRRAAVLAAISSAAARGPGSARGPGTVAELVHIIRQDGWRTLRSAPDRPSTMARMAAALLLVDPDDAPGRALVERATAALVVDGAGSRVVPGRDDRIDDSWIGTLALAIAARQAGQHSLADEMANSAMRRAYLVDRTGSEGVFWALAASAYGAFGVEPVAPIEAEIEIDGARRTLQLSGSAERIPLNLAAGTSGGVATLTSSSPVWWRMEARYLRPYTDTGDGPLEVTFDGSVGRAGEAAGLEVVVENVSGQAVANPVVELSLPGAARLNAAARRSVRSSASVAAIEGPDGAGVVRIRLATIPEDGSVRIPWPIQWLAAGTTRGLASAAYSTARPGAIRSTPEETYEIEAAQ